MENTRFGRLLVLRADTTGGTKNKRWVCRCDCGVEKSVLGFKLRDGSIASCGCYAKEYREEKQRVADEERRLYTKKSYQAMMGRCYDPKYPSYERYGAVGVSVCDRWRFGENGVSGWLCFFADMGPKPTGHSIDRIDNERGYEPGNCRWATRQQQQENRRRVGRRPKM